jgi:hypothetical protein
MEEKLEYNRRSEYFLADLVNKTVLENMQSDLMAACRNNGARRNFPMFGNS